MATTNFQLISDAAINAGLFTLEQAAEIIATFGELPLHTYAGWKSRGYQVRKGEKAKLKTTIWKHSGEYTDKSGKEHESHMFMKLSAFFTADQVEAIQPG